ncbi:MAG: MFS transporter [Lactobacillales bacterium]|jgi:DHA1 family multidrug resistance protein B-like MFS transporter|nr:MFS transporter [Lactobacillales bacterium]
MLKDFLKLSKDLKIRIGVNFLGLILSAIILPNMTIYNVQHFGLAVTGVLVGINAVITFAVGLYGGHYADIWGRRVTMLVGSVAVFGGYALIAIVNSPGLNLPWGTFAGFVIVSAGAAFHRPAEEAAMIDVSKREQRGFIYKMIYWLINVGLVIGSALGAWFFRDHFFGLSVATTAVAALSTAVIYIFIKESLSLRRRSTNTTGVWQVFRTYGAVVKDRKYLVFAAASIANTVIFMQLDTYYPAHLIESFHNTTIFGIEMYAQRMLSAALIINTAFIVLFMGAINRLTRRLSPNATIISGILVQGFSFSLSYLLHDFWPLAITAVILTVGEIMCVASTQVLRADLMASSGRVGAYSGFLAAMMPVAVIICGFMVSSSSTIGNVGVAIVLAFNTMFCAFAYIKSRKMLEKEQDK